MSASPPSSCETLISYDRFLFILEATNARSAIHAGKCHSAAKISDRSVHLPPLKNVFLTMHVFVVNLRESSLSRRRNWLPLREYQETSAKKQLFDLI